MADLRLGWDTEKKVRKLVQSGETIYAADAGSNDTYAITLSPAPTAYTTGMVVNFKANTANTGGVTLNCNSLGGVTLLKRNNRALETGDIESGQIVTAVHDGTYFQMQSQQANLTDADIPAALTGKTYNGVSVTSGTNTFNLAAGTGSLDIAAGKTLDVNANLTVSNDTTLTGSPYTPAGTDVAVADGGTGASTLTGWLQGNGTSAITGTAITLGGVTYGSAAGTMSELAGNSTATLKYLTQTGTGSASAAPGWNTIVDGDLPATIKGLTLTAAATGFTIAGGTTSKTLTVALDANVAGTNTGDVTLATNHGLGLTNQVLNMGTPSSVTGASTNAVATTTHTHALDLTAPPATGGTTPALTYFLTNMPSFAGNGTPTAVQLSGTIIQVTATGEIELTNVAAGHRFKVMSTTAAVIHVDPPACVMNLNGTDLASGNKATSDGSLGATLSCFYDGTKLWCVAEVGLWIDGGS